jgi:mono/diheme cytochrome c family protein
MNKLIKSIAIGSMTSLIIFSSYAEEEKPYQIVDGKISANAIEGWKTYNGGGCGTCHGKGGQGAVGPNLGQSVTSKLSKDDFKNTVTNGKPGTMMRPHKTNKRVMDNLDNLYAYLMARGDNVLGPGNLIKFPMGKTK